MARPRQFEDEAVLESAIRCFWRNGFEVASVRDLVEATGLSAPSLYNAFGDKRALFDKAVAHYVETRTKARLARLSELPPRRAIETFFNGIIDHVGTERGRFGCFLANSAMEVAAGDEDRAAMIRDASATLEEFFSRQIALGRKDGTINPAMSTQELSRMLVALFFGLRVAIRLKMQRAYLRDLVKPLQALLGDAERANLPRRARTGKNRTGPGAALRARRNVTQKTKE